jgi:hypothetical protein
MSNLSILRSAFRENIRLCDVHIAILFDTFSFFGMGVGGSQSDLFDEFVDKAKSCLARRRV